MSFQIEYNAILSAYCRSIDASSPDLDFLFLPITFFKSHDIKTGHWTPETVYLSSGTISSTRSRHSIKSKLWYLHNAKFIFENVFGKLSDYCFLCLLPSYLERGSSSLVDMCHYFIGESQFYKSGFYLHNHGDLQQSLEYVEQRGIPTFLIGVSYALMDFAEHYDLGALKCTRIMKTGGMKGNRKEIITEELDGLLKESFGVNEILGEYGMTECQSQMYSVNGISYNQNQRMRVVISDISDPFCYLEKNRTGRINIVDLANLDTCAFISTDDIGFIDDDNNVNVQGRLDFSDLRGCNLLL